MPEILKNTGGATEKKYVSRAAYKLAAALDNFGISVVGKTCVDLGSNVGGFVQVMLERGAKKVHAVEKGYGVLDWKLRKAPRVVVHERSDARTFALPEKVDLVTVDVGWTRLAQVLPAIQRLLKPDGAAILLLKPHYEAAPEERRAGIVKSSALTTIRHRVGQTLLQNKFVFQRELKSPLLGAKGGNPEFLWLVSIAN